MNSEKLDAKRIFGEALRLASPAERAAYLDQACGSNRELRGEVESLLRAQHLPLGVTRKRRVGGSRQGAIGKRFRSREVGGSRVAHLIEHARRQLPRQKTLYLL